LRDPRRSASVRLADRLSGGCACNARGRPVSYCLPSKFSINEAPINTKIGVRLRSTVLRGSINPH
jgi:hypothetical protein